MSRIPSSSQQQASRENGCKSHGPVSESGKAVSARNASFEVMEKKFGLSCPQQDPEMGRLLFGLMEDLQPDGLMQTLLVERIALFTFKLRRLERIEVQMLMGELDPHPTVPMTEARRQAYLRLQESWGQRPEDIPKPPSPDLVYLRSFKDSDRLLERLQAYQLKLTKAINATLREFRRMKKLAAEEVKESEAADERGSTQMEEASGEPTGKTGNCKPNAPPTGKNFTIEPEPSPPPVKLRPKQAFRAAIDQWVSHRLDHLGERLE